MRIQNKGIAVMKKTLVASIHSEVPVRTRTRSALRFGVVLLGLVAFLLTSVASAEGVNFLYQAKGKSQGGEQLDGYVGLIDKSAPDVIKKMVKDTNERRKAKYQKIAKQRGSTVESVSNQAGSKLTGRANPGEMIQNAEGKWVKK